MGYKPHYGASSMQAHPPAPSIASTSIGAEIRSSDTLLRLLADVVPA